MEFLLNFANNDNSLKTYILEALLINGIKSNIYFF